MKDVTIPADEIQDPQGLNMPDLNISRDPARTPMQWDSSNQAGFTTGKPWLRLSPDYTSNNVARQLKEDSSMLSLYQKLIKLRQSEQSLLYGQYRLIFADQQLIAFTRKLTGYDGFLIILNLSKSPAIFKTPSEIKGSIEITATGAAYDWKEGLLRLPSNEGMLIRLISTQRTRS
jgi:alpha-glucosidase